MTTTVRFSNTEKLQTIQSKIYLSTKQVLSKQQILDHAIDIIDANIDLLIMKISPSIKIYNNSEIDAIFDGIISDWGENMEDVSETIDTYLYGEKS